MRNRRPYPPLPLYVDPIFWKGKPASTGFARNSRGLHVPIAALTVAEQTAAWRWRSFCATADFSALDGAPPLKRRP